MSTVAEIDVTVALHEKACLPPALASFHTLTDVAALRLAKPVPTRPVRHGEAPDGVGLLLGMWAVQQTLALPLDDMARWLQDGAACLTDDAPGAGRQDMVRVMLAIQHALAGDFEGARTAVRRMKMPQPAGDEPSAQARGVAARLYALVHIGLQQALADPSLWPVATVSERVQVHRACQREAYALLSSVVDGHVVAGQDLALGRLTHFLRNLFGEKPSPLTYGHLINEVSSTGPRSPMRAESLYLHGLSLLSQGAIDKARRCLIDAIDTARDIGWRVMEWMAVRELAQIEQARGPAQASTCDSMAPQEVSGAVSLEALAISRAYVLGQAYPRPAIHDRGQRVEMACHYIAEHLERKITVQEIADHCGVTYRTVCTDFRAEMGTTVLDHITVARMRQAQVLLSDSNVAIGVVARRFGFKSTNGFQKAYARVHRKLANVT